MDLLIEQAIIVAKLNASDAHSDVPVLMSSGCHRDLSSLPSALRSRGMNQTVEKWLTIGALVGWVASIGSLVGLAIRAASPAVASRHAQASSLYSISRNNIEFDSATAQLRQLTSGSIAIQQKTVATTIPLDTSKGYWVESLSERSSLSSRWISERAK